MGFTKKEMEEKGFTPEQIDFVISDECEYSGYACAYLANKYNLPGPSLKALTITNNKYLQRILATKIKIPQPKFDLVWN